MQGEALPRFRDFSPEELAIRNHIFATWRAVARRYGFQEYDGPPLEPLELYTAKSGRDRGAAVRIHRQGGPQDRLAPRDDAHARPDGRGPSAGLEETDPLVLDPAALPLRAPAAGTVTGALPAEHGHPGRGGAARRCRARRRGDRPRARLRGGARRRGGAALGPAGGPAPRCGGSSSQRGGAPAPC